MASQGHFAPSQGRDSGFAAASVIVIISRRYHRARRRTRVFYRNNLKTGSFSPLSVIVITRRASVLPRSKGGALASAEPPGSAADLYTHLRWGYKYASLARFFISQHISRQTIAALRSPRCPVANLYRDAPETLRNCVMPQQCKSVTAELCNNAIT